MFVNKTKQYNKQWNEYFSLYLRYREKNVNTRDYLKKKSKNLSAQRLNGAWYCNFDLALHRLTTLIINRTVCNNVEAVNWVRN